MFVHVPLSHAVVQVCVCAAPSDLICKTQAAGGSITARLQPLRDGDVGAVGARELIQAYAARLTGITRTGADRHAKRYRADRSADPLLMPASSSRWAKQTGRSMTRLGMTWSLSPRKRLRRGSCVPVQSHVRASHVMGRSWGAACVCIGRRKVLPRWEIHTNTPQNTQNTQCI